MPRIPQFLAFSINFGDCYKIPTFLLFKRTNFNVSITPPVVFKF